MHSHIRSRLSYEEVVVDNGNVVFCNLNIWYTNMLIVNMRIEVVSQPLDSGRITYRTAQKKIK